MGSRVADAPVKSTAVAVNKDSREEDLPIMVDGMWVQVCAERKTRIKNDRRIRFG
jgi:hypothetical protein